MSSARVGVFSFDTLALLVLYTASMAYGQYGEPERNVG